MAKTSAGLLMYKIKEGRALSCFLVHPGGPYYQGKHIGTWGIPKGLVEEGEELLEAGIREFVEETGISPQGPYIPLESIRYRKGKVVHAWAFEGEWIEKNGISSNTFRTEWPPKSGNTQEFPEVDEARWMGLEEVYIRMHPAQWPLIVRLCKHLAATGVKDLQQIAQQK